MSISKFRNSTAVDTVLKNGNVPNAPTTQADLKQAHEADKSIQGATRNATTDRVSTYLRGISENSTDEIDGLISDLSALRKKLVTDGSKLEQDLLDFAALNESVLSLTKIVSESVTQVKTPQSH